MLRRKFDDYLMVNRKIKHKQALLFYILLKTSL